MASRRGLNKAPFALPFIMAARPSTQIPPTISASSLVPQNLVALADPPVRQIDGAVFDYFLIELVNTLRVSAAVATERSKKIEAEMVEAGLIPAPPVPPHPLKKEAPSARDSVTSLNSRASTGGRMSSADEAEEAVRSRLEAIGLHVGANFTERYICARVLLVCSKKVSTGYVATARYSVRRSTRSSSFAKTSGPPAGTSRSTIYEPIIAWVTTLIRHLALC